MRILKVPGQIFRGLIGRELADIRSAAGAIALRKVRPKLDALLSE
jgi:hypothetical protein